MPDFGRGRSAYQRHDGLWETGQARGAGGFLRLPAPVRAERLVTPPVGAHAPAIWNDRVEAAEVVGPTYFLRGGQLVVAPVTPARGATAARTGAWKILLEGVVAAAVAGGRVYFTRDREAVFSMPIGARETDAVRCEGLQDIEESEVPGEAQLQFGRWRRYRLAVGARLLVAEERFQLDQPRDWNPLFREAYVTPNTLGDVSFPSLHATFGASALVAYTSADGITFQRAWRTLDPLRYKEFFRLDRDTTVYRHRALETGLALVAAVPIGATNALEEVSGLPTALWASMRLRVPTHTLVIDDGVGSLLHTRDGGVTWERMGGFAIIEPETGYAVTSECELVSKDR